MLVFSGLLFSGCGDRDPEPTVASVDFTPRAVVTVDESALRIEGTDAATAPIDGDDPVLTAGTVVEIRNVGTDAHRIVAGTVIDTGVMEPGDATTVVLANEGDLEVRDLDSGRTLTLTVEPRSGSG
jgi:hypothetical protein